MKKTAAISLLSAALIITCLLFSCVPQKKAASGKKELEKLDSQLVKHSDDLKKLDEKEKASSRKGAYLYVFAKNKYEKMEKKGFRII